MCYSQSAVVAKGRHSKRVMEMSEKVNMSTAIKSPTSNTKHSFHQSFRARERELVTVRGEMMAQMDRVRTVHIIWCDLENNPNELH